MVLKITSEAEVCKITDYIRKFNHNQFVKHLVFDNDAMKSSVRVSTFGFAFVLTKSNAAFWVVNENKFSVCVLC